MHHVSIRHNEYKVYISNNGRVIHTENNENKIGNEDLLKYEATMTEDGVTVQRTLFVNQLMEQSERDKTIRAGLEGMSLPEARAELLRLHEREAKWIERILEEAKREGKAGSDLSTYIMTRMNEPDEGQLDLKKRETVLLNMIVHMTVLADREIHKETDRARQTDLLIDTYGLKLLTRARFTKERVQYMEGRGLIIRDKRPLLDVKRKPQDLYMMEPTVVPINNNPTLDLIHKLYAEIVEELRAAPVVEDWRATFKGKDSLVIPYLLTQSLRPNVKELDKDIFEPGLYTQAYHRESTDKVLELTFQDGSVYEKGKKEPIMDVVNVGTSEKALDLDHGLLMAIYTECAEHGEHIGGSQYTIKFSSLMNRMGKNARGKSRDEILKKMGALSNAWAVFPDKPNERKSRSFYQLMGLSYDEDTDILLVTMDFFLLYNGRITREYWKRKQKYLSKKQQSLIPEAIEAKEGQIRRDGHHSLARMSLSSVRNKSAYYLVLSILELISGAGVSVSKSKPEKDVHKKVQDLIRDNPILRDRLERAGDSNSKKNVILRRAFSDAYEYLREHTRIYEYYKDLKIDETFKPSWTDVEKGASLMITHRGKAEE